MLTDKLLFSQRGPEGNLRSLENVWRELANHLKHVTMGSGQLSSDEHNEVSSSLFVWLPATFDERCWILHVSDCTHVRFVPYLFTVPAAAHARSFQHLWMGKNVVRLEKKNTNWRAPQGYLLFISRPVTVVVCGEVHLCNNLLSNTPRLSVLSLLRIIQKSEIWRLELFAQEIRQVSAAASWTERPQGTLIKHIRVVSKWQHRASG